MRFLLDTDTCVFWLRGHVAVRGRFAAVATGELAISIVTVAELRYGAACSARPEDNQRAVDAFVGAIAVLGLDQAAARAFGDIKADLRNRGMLIDDLDLLIAATARAHGLTVVTNNRGHFGRIPGLSLESWV